MKYPLLLTAILLFGILASSNILLARNSPVLFTTAVVSDNPVSISNCTNVTSDPFIGVFTMSAYGQTMGNVTITHAGGNQYKIDSGDGADIATKNGQALEGTSQGVPFQIRINGDNLVMELLGTTFDLIRINTQGAQPSYKNAGNKTEDPYVGTFTASANGQEGGTITITHTGGNNYKFETSTGTDNATKNGNALEGISGGVAFRIFISGNDLVMELMGNVINLTRMSGNQTEKPQVISSNIDRRLIGVWRNSSSYVSGSASSSSKIVIAFSENGTFERQRSSSIGGDGWSGGESIDPIQRGVYSITKTTSNGGTVVINGEAMAYEFYIWGGEQRMFFDNYKTPWEKIR